MHPVEGFGEGVEHGAVDTEPIGSGRADAVWLGVLLSGVAEVGLELLHDGEQAGKQRDAAGAAAGAGVDEAEGVVGGD